MLNGHFNAGVLLKFFTDLGQTVIALVAVDPDNQFTFLNFGESRGGNHHRRKCG
ncbi:hypothetical protein LTSEURB_6130 [Salmonella enterica subsp. enterica serovar Urbana str. R8-2977]|uniref:Uncharacterized protein n=1 Tax=Salmonella enterica subsp. enterica serovar Urbana str. R8-2977 TaxID=913084 RepID=G5S3Z7_SALET|nr:hypothetical protein LTSEURB_6130 [Salmonella enterica subsp. enterica serovar Urbana str. R8-2977]